MDAPGKAVPRWEHFAHEADMGVRGFGASLGQAFEQGALAMTALVTDPAGVEPRERVTIECTAPDPELLFAEWLNSVIYEMATRHMVFNKFAVAVQGTVLQAEMWGERIAADRHDLGVEVKGATYTALQVANEGAHQALRRIGSCGRQHDGCAREWPLACVHPAGFDVGGARA